jgi:phospholipase C
MALNNIEHIVVLMLENRSFDHFLGSLSLNGRSDVDGLQKGMTVPDASGVEQPIKEITNERFLTDPGHGFADVQAQLANGNRGFITNYATMFKSAAQGKKLAPEIIRYQTKKTLPVTYALAEEYAICDQWFSPVPSETWPNRIFASAATTRGNLTNKIQLYNLQTVFSRLRDGRREWAVYNDQIPNLVNIKALAGEWLRTRHAQDSRFPSIQSFFIDCKAGRLPEYSWIEPVYFEKAGPIRIATANDDHPPHDIAQGQRFIASIYRALRTSPLWEKSMLVILTDEHGGFYDHVVPPSNVPPPDASPGDFGFDFKQLGVRVPVVVVSPLISKRKVIRSASGFFDHTSLIRTVCERWNLPPLTSRDAAANSLGAAIDLDVPRTDDKATLKFIDAFLAQAQPKGLTGGPTTSAATINKSGRTVASMLSVPPPQAKGLGLAGAADTESEFQESMRGLAALIDARADELEVTPST